jgi:hypothetical protein
MAAGSFFKLLWRKPCFRDKKKKHHFDGVDRAGPPQTASALCDNFVLPF